MNDQLRTIIDPPATARSFNAMAFVKISSKVLMRFSPIFMLLKSQPPRQWLFVPLIVLGNLVHADDAASEHLTVSSPQLEPIEFIDNPKPRRTDSANPRPEPAIPSGWGSAAFSNDGQLVATVSVVDGKEATGEVSIWNLADPTKTVRFEQSARIATVAFSPDGQLLALGPHTAQSGIKIIDTKTGELVSTLPGAVAPTNAITNWRSQVRSTRPCESGTYPIKNSFERMNLKPPGYSPLRSLQRENFWRQRRQRRTAMAWRYLTLGRRHQSKR